MGSGFKRFWAKLLGLVHVSMFGTHKASHGFEDAAVLLDGTGGSLAFLRSKNADIRQLLEDDLPLSWSWSANVRHAVIVVPDGPDGKLITRRWDDRRANRQDPLPQYAEAAVDLLEDLQASPAPSRPDVIRHVLQPFRKIRQRLEKDSPEWAVKILNGLLLAIEHEEDDATAIRNLLGVSTFGKLVSRLPTSLVNLAELQDLPKHIRQFELLDLLELMTTPDPYTGCRLLPNLLFRHAASRLYQEAHLEIERNPQLYLLGMEPAEEPIGKSPRDVRFTPPNLARALTQKALDGLARHRKEITVLDPACGSGVFLVEALRELSARGVRAAQLIGYDILPVSTYTTKVCLQHGLMDIPSNYRPEIVTRDSLDPAAPWSSADLVLMNPPFIPWDRLSDPQKQLVQHVLGSLSEKRPDIAMAFVWRAMQCLNPGGILACVLPSPLLSSESGQKWREAIAEIGDLRLIGVFEGYRYFSTSLVETSFVLIEKRSTGEKSPRPVEILITGERREDAGLRALRLDQAEAARMGVEHFSRALSTFSSESWRPLRKSAYDIRGRLEQLKLPTVSKLFEVKQGVRAGHKVFLLNTQQWATLPAFERKRFFRPAAGGGSIRDGRLRESEYVFYPYSLKGDPLLPDEEALRKEAPSYYRQFLLPVKEILANRPRFAGRNWWELSEKREWQLVPSPHIISTYFGESGSFAFDGDGRFVTVNGHAWFWKRGKIVQDHEEYLFEESPLPYAYLAILNSPSFERVVSLFSVRLQGGQMRLEPRYIRKVPMFDLTDETQVSSEHVKELVNLGRAIVKQGVAFVSDRLERIVNQLYACDL